MRLATTDKHPHSKASVCFLGALLALASSTNAQVLLAKKYVGEDFENDFGAFQQPLQPE